MSTDSKNVTPMCFDDCIKISSLQIIFFKHISKTYKTLIFYIWSKQHTNQVKIVPCHFNYLNLARKCHVNLTILRRVFWTGGYPNQVFTWLYQPNVNILHFIFCLTFCFTKILIYCLFFYRILNCRFKFIRYGIYSSIVSTTIHFS